MIDSQPSYLTYNTAEYEWIQSVLANKLSTNKLFDVRQDIANYGDLPKKGKQSSIGKISNFTVDRVVHIFT